MRLWVVLAALLALVGVLVFALREPAVAPLEPSPRPAGLHAPVEEPAIPLAEASATARSAGDAQREAAPPRDAERLPSVRVEVQAPDGRVPAGRLGLRLGDELGRPVELVPVAAGVLVAGRIEPGTYALHVDPEGPYARHSHEFTVPPEAREHRVVVRLAALETLRLRWQTPDGAPFLAQLTQPGALDRAVVLLLAPDDVERVPGAPLPDVLDAWRQVVLPGGTRFDPAGAWPAAPPDAAHELLLHSGRPAFLSAAVEGVVVGTVPIGPDDAEVVLRSALPTQLLVHATVRGCVVDAATGAPVVGAEVEFQSQGGLPIAPIPTGADGCFRDERLCAREWQLRIRSEEHAEFVASVTPTAGGELDLGVVRLDAGSELLVRTRGPDGAAVGGIRIQVHAFESGAPVARLERTTDASGTARITRVPRARHVVCCESAAHAASAVEVDLASGAAASVNLVVAPGREQVLDFGPSVLHPRQAWIWNGEGTFLGRRPLDPFGRVPVRLVPGEYVVEIEGAQRAHRITVDGTSARYDLR